MSTDTTPEVTGFIHEAAFYDSDVELLDVVIPFLEEAVQAGQPAVAALDERGNGLVRAALREQSGVLFVDGMAEHQGPANTITAYRGSSPSRSRSGPARSGLRGVCHSRQRGHHGNGGRATRPPSTGCTRTFPCGGSARTTHGSRRSECWTR